MKQEFTNIFGKDILTKEFDADMYKGGAYIEVKNDTAYIIEVSWECETMRLVKLPNVSVEMLFDLLIEKTDDYYTIGEIYVEHRKTNISSEENVRKALCSIYNREVNWVLEDNISSEVFNIDYDNSVWKCNDL